MNRLHGNTVIIGRKHTRLVIVYVYVKYRIIVICKLTNARSIDDLTVLNGTYSNVSISVQ